MVTSTETTRRRTIVPLTVVPDSQQQARPEWTTDKDPGDGPSKGTHGDIHIPGVMWIDGDAAFAQGFRRVRAVMRACQDAQGHSLDEDVLTHLMAQQLPTTLSPIAMDRWIQGFIVGWCLTRHAHLCLDAAEETIAEEARTTPVPEKSHKDGHCSAPKYPNALKACIKQAGYSLREVSRETAIPESTLRHWASGASVIPHASREQLAHVIGCSVEELVPKRVAL